MNGIVLYAYGPLRSIDLSVPLITPPASSYQGYVGDLCAAELIHHPSLGADK